MVNFDIQKTLAIISSTGSTEKALTVTSWNDRPAKLDLRVWREADGEKLPGKGITLDEAEAAALAAALNSFLSGRETA